jgi:hypothetical protein
MQQDQNFSPTAAFPSALDRIKRSITPIEFAGSCGDVILYHHLAVHSTGINTSQHVRIGSIHDYQRVQPPSHVAWDAKVGGGAGIVLRADGSPTMPDFNREGQTVI